MHIFYVSGKTTVEHRQKELTEGNSTFFYGCGLFYGVGFLQRKT